MTKSDSRKLKPEKRLNRSTNNNDGDKDFLIVGIGASAGGIQALKEFFENVSVNSNLAYVVILHLSPEHESHLAEVLQHAAPIPVTQVTKRVKVEPNHVYVVAPSEHLRMEDGHIVVSPNVNVEERRAPVDIFFRTLADSHHARAVAVILSGTGADGSMGLKRIKENGGATFVQNPREAEFSEMPRNSIATELVDAVLNARDIPSKIAAYKANIGAIVIQDAPESRPEEDKASLREIFTHLRVRTGHNFTNYKRATVLRRIERRINVSNSISLKTYAAFLIENPNEAHALLKDLLISVTNFFRDKEPFQFLEREILPKILRDKNARDQIRVWVAGCATGEEAYSLAMLFAELIDERLDAQSIQIFATDIDDAAIATAREGFYTINDAADVSPERLQRFFTKDGDGFRVRRELRETVLFANHNLIKDPPFSRLDLITCRNLLIYLNETAQERAMATFHFALNPGGYLFLGTSETADGSGDLFASANREHHIYQSRGATARTAYSAPEAPPFARFTQAKAQFDEKAADEERRLRERLSLGELHQRMLEQYAPPSIVVNENYDIIHLSDNAGRFLQIVGGEPSKNLIKMIRPELRLELRTALYQAVNHKTNVEAHGVKFQANGNAEAVNIHVRPVLREDDAARGFLLVVFESTAAAEQGEEQIDTAPVPVALQLEEELERIKLQLRQSIEQFEIQTEELKASNEELQAMNEELRSSTEELETSREELQSVNEELITVNQELKIKIEELSASNNDFQNLMNSTDIGTIFLDCAFRVKFFTPSARALFNLIEADLNRPLADIATKLDFGKLLGDVEDVLRTLKTAEREVQADKNKWYLLRIFPYRTADDKINGVVIAFIDITRRKLSESHLNEVVGQLKRQSRLFDTTLSAISDFAYIFDRDGRFLYSNQPLLDLFDISAQEIVGKNFFDLNYPTDLAARLQAQIQYVFDTKKPVRDETPFVTHTGGTGYYEYIFTPVFGDDGTIESVAGSTRDVTERKLAEETLRESELQMRLVVEAAEMGTWDWNLTSGKVRWNRQHYLLFGLEPGDGWVNYTVFEQGVHPDDREKVRKRLMTAIEENAVFQTDFRVLLPDGSTRWMSGYGRVVEHGADGRASRMTGVMFDATERREAEEALRESGERLRLLVENTSDYAIFTTTPENLIDSWNAGAEKVFGWTESEAVGQSGAIIFTPEDRTKNEPENEMATALREGRAPDERFHVRKDGSRFFVSGVSTPLRDGSGDLRGFVKIARDMTERLEAEKVLREKEILQRMVGAQEDERKRIARDIHDQLGQRLTGLRLELEAARRECEESDEELCDRIDEIQTIARYIDDDVDFIAWELRPASLDDLGLRVTLANFIKEWALHVGIRADFHSTGVGRRRFSQEIETNFYRITQEALNNICKHAEASSVSVLLEKRGGNLELIVEDDGIGFNTKNKRTKDKGIGLIGMKERAAIMGGTIEIESAKGKGTTVYVRVPFKFVDV